MTHSFAALDHAFDLAKDKKYDEALGICNNFVLNWPHAYAGYYRKSNVLSMMGRHDDALRALDKSPNCCLSARSPIRACRTP